MYTNAGGDGGAKGVKVYSSCRTRLYAFKVLFDYAVLTVLQSQWPSGQVDWNEYKIPLEPDHNLT